MVTDPEFERFRKVIIQFAETHKVISVSTAIGSSMAGGSAIVATISGRVRRMLSSLDFILPYLHVGLHIVLHSGFHI